MAHFENLSFCSGGNLQVHITKEEVIIFASLNVTLVTVSPANL